MFLQFLADLMKRPPMPARVREQLGGRQVFVKELARELADRVDWREISHFEARRIIELVCEIKTRHLDRGERVIIPGWGTYHLKRLRGGRQRMPNGDVIQNRDRDRPSFTPAEKLVEALDRETLR